MLSYQVLMEHYFHLSNLIIMESDVNFDIIETGNHRKLFHFFSDLQLREFCLVLTLGKQDFCLHLWLGEESLHRHCQFA